MTTTDWHQIIETPDDDNECVECKCVVTNEALLTFTLSCPAPHCSSPMNPDDGCVFVPGRSQVCRCIYCGAPGGRVQDLPEDVRGSRDFE